MFEGLKTKVASGKKLASVEKPHFDQYDAGKAFHKKQQASLAAAIEAARHKLNGAAPQ